MEDFENVKIGDKVVISRHFGGRSIATVKKVNKASFVVDCGNYDMAFMKKGGREKGGSTWNSAYAHQATDELVKTVGKENRKAKYVSACRACKFEDLSYETLEQIYNLIK